MGKHTITHTQESLMSCWNDHWYAR